jgi:Undecaprenyl-phosphate glucose phosphotransferase
MFQRLTVYKIAFVNIFFAALLMLTWHRPLLVLSIKVAAFMANGCFLFISLHNIHRFLRRNDERLFIGRKRTLIVFASFVYMILLAGTAFFDIATRELSIFFVSWTTIMLITHFFSNPISIFLHTIFRKRRRIAIVGFDDNANKLAEKLKSKNSHFIEQFDNQNSPWENNPAHTLSSYIDFAKKNHINEFYVSVPEEENTEIAVLAEEAEKHCIRVNFISPQQNLKSGFYHVHYIGGMPVLKRYREPLRRLHKQFLKRSFDIAVSSLVIIFILSWLIPIVSLLIKLESKGPVFFKQLRSGRDNGHFICLKFRSMYTNDASDLIQATKNDARITRVGAFLRKTSLDEFPQFLNVFMGNMSIVGPRPHMLHHTEQYSSQVNHYMVRLYLKPGLTGWAQVKGYRGEIRNIELLKSRVDHDIWYMENWSLLLDVKIMFMTLYNIIKGEENAY